jgi:glycosyltransferase involved in cell wall biosynthesis
VRIAWFSPLPPVRTGIAGRSAELLAALRTRGHEIDEYPEQRAHDFPWRQRQYPYDLVVYQFGNSSHHDYEWSYALRWPGLVVLHDTHLHHSRAALLLREKRVDDYRAEFRWSHPDVTADAAELAVAGFDSALYYRWPMARALVLSARLTAVHGHGARQELIESLASTEGTEKIVSIRLGEGEPVRPEREARARREVRDRYGIDADAVLFGCFGGLTPEKRIPQILAALGALLPYAPSARLLLAGARAAHYDPAADAAALGVSDRVVLAGYLETDAALTDHIAACDVSLNLRWPTAGETSGPWLRALAAGKATVITDLAHLTEVPSLDPRTWRVQEARDAGREARDARSEGRGAVCVAIDMLGEDHSLRLAMRRLAADADMRARLGRAAREYWAREHSIDAMTDDYERVMREAAHETRGARRGAEDAESAEIPGHLRANGNEKLRALLTPFGLEPPI